jgi:hypothetical protein
MREALGSIFYVAFSRAKWAVILEPNFSPFYGELRGQKPTLPVAKRQKAPIIHIQMANMTASRKRC